MVKNSDGCWMYNHMVLQLKDYIDILNYVYPGFDFVFFLDHSIGHDCMRPNGLNINKIGVRYGGKQPRMCELKLSNAQYFEQYLQYQPGNF